MSGLDVRGGTEAPVVFRDDLPRELKLFKGRLSPRFFEMRAKVVDFIKTEVLPNLDVYKQEKDALDKTVSHPVYAPEPPILRTLRGKAKARGLFNFFLPEVCGLTVLEYSPIAELLGSVPLANFAMNCSAPDTGNMEVLERYGSKAQQEKWLKPLLAGEIRSAFAMTEPGVASSDATNICSMIEKKNDHYLVNGHKWYISGACRPECKVFVFMGRSTFSGPQHKQHSMILIPRDAPGVKILRPLGVFGHLHDHAEIIFDNVRVPLENMILGEGRGFEIAQGRLGPGRIHHCMRTVGIAEAGLDAMLHRINSRVAFGDVLSKKDAIRQKLAEARLEITKSRLLCYFAAAEADDNGFKNARTAIAMTKVDAPRTCLKVLDEAIQMYGAHGVSQDSMLSEIYADVRTLRVADGPDIVHLNTIAKEELKREPTALGRTMGGTNHNIEKYGKYKHIDLRKYNRSRGGGGGSGEMIARL
eukprot:TRINITY_DN1625_c2_g2_i1.p1 TRINITY_DN1625_c2_g2~~TRINITY_DN1625_c2_g2_i1.p1  ORF type:complete len:473 (+),score=233.10 TRINITY_DN1625_c2_g2_i1:92-1510(+)